VVEKGIGRQLLMRSFLSTNSVKPRILSLCAITSLAIAFENTNVVHPFYHYIQN